MGERDEITRRWEFEFARMKGGYQRQIAHLQGQLVEARRQSAPPDTITIDGHTYVRLVLCPRDEPGGAIDASEI